MCFIMQNEKIGKDPNNKYRCIYRDLYSNTILSNISSIDELSQELNIKETLNIDDDIDEDNTENHIDWVGDVVSIIYKDKDADDEICCTCTDKYRNLFWHHPCKQLIYDCYKIAETIFNKIRCNYITKEIKQCTYIFTRSKKHCTRFTIDESQK